MTATPVLKYFQKIEFAIRCEPVKTDVTSQDFDLLPGEGWPDERADGSRDFRGFRQRRGGSIRGHPSPFRSRIFIFPAAEKKEKKKKREQYHAFFYYYKRKSCSLLLRLCPSSAGRALRYAPRCAAVYGTVLPIPSIAREEAAHLRPPASGL